MSKRFVLAAATSMLLATAAYAQSSSPTPAPTDKMAAPAATSTMNAPAGKPTTVSEQKPDQWLASTFKGADVMGPDDKKIGDVTDILFDKTGSIQAIVVGVGGFLGIGTKDVALTLASFQVIPGKDAKDPSDFTLKLAMTKDELKNAPAFKPYQPPRPAASPTAGGPLSGPQKAPPTQ